LHAKKKTKIKRDEVKGGRVRRKRKNALERT